MAKPYEKRIDWQRIYHKYRRSNAKERNQGLWKQIPLRTVELL